MELKWTSKALSDLARLHDFLAKANPPAARKTLQTLTKTVAVLKTNPRLGEQLFEFSPQEVRRLIIGHYELRYEVRQEMVLLLRLWHTREAR
jgi:plasmid stabilization system protein ParE